MDCLVRGTIWISMQIANHKSLTTQELMTVANLRKADGYKRNLKILHQA